MSSWSKPLVFRNRHFALVWMGQVLSQAGTRMYQIAVMWWLASHAAEGSEGVTVAWFMVACALPSILLVKSIGRVIDRSASRRVMMTAELIAASVIAVLGLLFHQGSLGQGAFYVAGLCLALCQAFIDPTLGKSVPELVAPADIENAVAFETSTQSLANFAGAVFGAFLVGWIGIGGVIALNLGSCLLSTLCLSLAHFRPTASPTATIASETTSAWGVLQELPLVKKILICFGIANFFATPLLLVLPLYTKLALKADASALGLLEACLWVGLILGSFAGRFPPSRWNIIKLSCSCLMLFGGCLIIPALLIHQVLFMVCLIVGGACLGLNNVKFVSLFQQIVPDHLKGRFFAMMQALLSATFPVAYYVFGYLCDLWHPANILIIMGGGLGVLSLYLATLASSLRNGPAPAAARERIVSA